MLIKCLLLHLKIHLNSCGCLSLSKPHLKDRTWTVNYNYICYLRMMRFGGGLLFGVGISSISV